MSIELNQTTEYTGLNTRVTALESGGSSSSGGVAYGTGTLAAGRATVTDSRVQSASVIIPAYKIRGTGGQGFLSVIATTSGSFTVESSDATDNGTFGFIIANSVGTTSGGTVNTTPAAPTITQSDSADTISASHTLGNSEIVVSVNDAAYAAYTGAISVGDVARSAGYYKFKIKAATGRNESAVVSSQAFTVAQTGGGTVTPAIWEAGRIFDFDADSAVLSGSNVVSVPSSVDSSYSMTQSSTTKRGTIQSSAFGTHSGILLDATDDGYDIEALPNLATSGITIAYIAKQPVNSGTSTRILNGTTNFALSITGTLQWYQISGAGGYATNLSLAASTPLLIIAEVDATSFRLYRGKTLMYENTTDARADIVPRLLVGASGLALYPEAADATLGRLITWNKILTKTANTGERDVFVADMNSLYGTATA